MIPAIERRCCNQRCTPIRRTKEVGATPTIESGRPRIHLRDGLARAPPSRKPKRYLGVTLPFCALARHRRPSAHGPPPRRRDAPNAQRLSERLDLHPRHHQRSYGLSGGCFDRPPNACSQRAAWLGSKYPHDATSISGAARRNSRAKSVLIDATSYPVTAATTVLPTKYKMIRYAGPVTANTRFDWVFDRLLPRRNG